ncbi:ABC transporter permease [Bifidobacterium aemilianum]|uniref:ABC transporter permease n=1 Tax=Bifidobacterium aemilianum TaxID=2493120 RepID=A0A366K9A0_9BIFI|nr:ABC transporter permease [Bifidobacterium aemilianum]RBP97703.1 ABC transporter permease [Bifidobacterium aemilianum]
MATRRQARGAGLKAGTGAAGANAGSDTGTGEPLWRRLLPPAITIGCLLAVWQLAVTAGHVSERTLASPSQIVRSMVNTWPELMEATSITCLETISGFIIAVAVGLLIGVGLYVSKTLNRAFYPLLVAAQTIPLITIAPLFMLWFGFEPTGKIILVAVLGLFPIAVETSRGLQAVPRYYEDVALTCGATSAWTLWHVKLRVAARQIFGGVRISAAYVFGTAVTAEYLGATNGLGIWLQAAFNSFQTPPIFSATIVIVALTALLLGLVSLCEYLLLGGNDRIEDIESGL